MLQTIPIHTLTVFKFTDYNLINIKCSEVINFKTCCLFSDVMCNQMGHVKDENCNVISSKATIKHF